MFGKILIVVLLLCPFGCDGGGILGGNLERQHVTINVGTPTSQPVDVKAGPVTITVTQNQNIDDGGIMEGADPSEVAKAVTTLPEKPVTPPE